MAYKKFALQTLQHLGFKLTDQRIEVIELLSRSKLPLSTHEIQLHTQIPAVSIYRILQLLQDVGLIHKVHGTKFLKCNHLDTQGCHHFMICNDCGSTEEFVMDQHIHIPPTKSFTPTGHTFEINGFCKKCYITN